MTFLVDILLQGSLPQKLVKGARKILCANLVIHQDSSDVLHQATKLVRIPGPVYELLDFASLLHWDEFLKDISKFPSKLSTSPRVSYLREGELPFENCPPLFLIVFALGNRCAQRFCQLFDPWYQRHYRFAARNRLLGQP